MSTVTTVTTVTFAQSWVKQLLRCAREGARFQERPTNHPPNGASDLEVLQYHRQDEMEQNQIHPELHAAKPRQ